MVQTRSVQMDSELAVGRVKTPVGVEPTGCGRPTRSRRCPRPPPRRVTSASSNQCPCQEPNGHRPKGGPTTFAESRASTTLQGHIGKYPAEESNLARLLRRQSCVLHTRRAFLNSGLPRSAFILAIARRPTLLPVRAEHDLHFTTRSRYDIRSLGTNFCVHGAMTCLGTESSFVLQPESQSMIYQKTFNCLP